MSAATVAEPLELRAPRVLLVEDDMSHAEIVRRVLAEQQAAAHLVHVADGEAAIAYLDGRPDARSLPDMLLLDLQLRRLGGLEVLKAIRSRDDWCAMPVIVLSTSAAAADLGAAYRHGANSYVVKPLDVKGFERMLSALGRFWFVWNRGYGTRPPPGDGLC